MGFYTNVKVMGDKIYVRGIDDDGTRYIKREIDYSPILFNPSRTKTDYTTLDGKYVSPKPYETIGKARKKIEDTQDIFNSHVYGCDRFDTTYIGEEYPNDIDYDLSKIIIANIDIEVASDEGFPVPELAMSPIISIAVKYNDKFFVFGYGEPDGCNIKHTLADRGINYISCKNESDLLDRFLDSWIAFYPDIVTGWNVNGFDIPYIINRLEKIKGKRKSRLISPWGYYKDRKVPGRYGGETIKFLIAGISVLDYFELYQKFTYVNRETYRLDYIANVELGESKLSYSEFGNLHTLYKRDYHKFIEYNVKDVELVDRLEDKMKLIEMAIALAYSAKVNFSEVFSQVRMWESLCYHHLNKSNKVFPERKESNKTSKFEGAYVKDPQVGFHRWVVSFDLNSLYPHLMMQYNLSPENLLTEEDVSSDLVATLREDVWQSSIEYDKIIDKELDTSLLKRDNLTIAPNLMFFKRDEQGFLPEILEDLYNRRKESKRKMIECQQKLQSATGEEKQKYINLISKHNNDQLARKVQLNSAYGALGNEYFRFYDLRIAEAVTKAGQLSIRWIEKRINEYLNELLKTSDVDYVLASDTDSIYVVLDKLVESVFENEKDNQKIVRFLDKVCNKTIEPYIEKCYNDLAEYMNAYDQKMVMKREAIASTGLWTAKKRYVLNVYDNEGVFYSEPKLKVMGLEAVKSSTPEVCREKIRKVLEIVMNGTEDQVQEYISKFKNEFCNLPAEDIAFPRGVNGIQKYSEGGTYIKGTPIHVKGCIVYNRLIEKLNLNLTYPTIKDGDKIKFMYLRQPNPIGESVISTQNALPEEFGLNDYVDYDKQFEKTFLDPVKVLLDCIGWKPEYVNTLERFFG